MIYAGGGKNNASMVEQVWLSMRCCTVREWRLHSHGILKILAPGYPTKIVNY